MAAPKGNQFWKNRSKHGREKLFSTPELLEEAAHEYFEWCDDNPWIKKEVIKSGNMAGEIIDIPTQRPYTIAGLCLYCQASRNWWKEFKKNANEDFLAVLSYIEDTIYSQKYDGAAVGAFNPMIISRDIGLSDKQEIDHKNDGGKFEPPKISFQ